MSEVEILWVTGLPESTIGAAAAFYSRYPLEIRAIFGEGAQLLIIAMPQAPYDHDDWRRAAARDLAREYAPRRVVIVAGDHDEAVTETIAYLENAPGVSGQLLKLNR